MNEVDAMWNRFVETGALDLAKRKLEVMVGQCDQQTLYWAFQRTLAYLDPISPDMLADAVAKRAASAIKRQQRENYSLAKELTGGICLGALA